MSKEESHENTAGLIYEPTDKQGHTQHKTLANQLQARPYGKAKGEIHIVS